MTGKSGSVGTRGGQPPWVTRPSISLTSTFTALAEDVAAQQCQRLGQLGVFFFQLVVVRGGLIEHSLEFAKAAFCVFGLKLSSLGLLPQLLVAAKQVLQQPLAFTRITREACRDLSCP